MRDGLALGVEAHRVRPVGRQVAEQRALPAPERVVGHRHRQRHVDADHADQDVVAEVARRLAVPREDAGAVAVLMAVDQVHGLLQRADAHDAQHRAEDLVLVDRHAGLHVVEQAGADEVAVLVAGGQLHVAAVDQQRGAFLDALGHVAPDLLAMRLRDQRAHVVRRIGAGAHLHLGDLGLQARDHRFGRALADRDDQRHRHAALAAGAESGAHHRADGIADVRVRHHHRVVLRAAERLHPLAVGGAGRIHILGDRRRADEAHRLDAPVLQQRVDSLLVAVDDVQHAWRQAGFQRQLGHQQRAGRVPLGGLQHEGVAADDGHRPHPQRHHDREVERRDAGRDPERLELAPGVDRRPDIAAVLALEQLRRIAGELDVLDAALQLAVRVADDLAVLGGQQRTDLVRMFLEQLLELAHHAGALERRRGAPGRVGGLRRRDRLLDRRGVGQQHALLGAAGGRVEHVLGAAAAGDELAVDQVADGRQAGAGARAGQKGVLVHGGRNFRGGGRLRAVRAVRRPAR